MPLVPHLDLPFTEIKPSGVPTNVTRESLSQAGGLPLTRSPISATPEAEAHSQYYGFAIAYSAGSNRFPCF